MKLLSSGESSKRQDLSEIKPDVFFCDYSRMPLLLVDPGQAGKMTVTAKQVSILVATNVSLLIKKSSSSKGSCGLV